MKPSLHKPRTPCSEASTPAAIAACRTAAYARLRRSIAHCARLEGTPKGQADLMGQAAVTATRSQQDLQHLTRRLMKGQEKASRALSGKLEDEIAQMLVGISVRLLSMQQSARMEAVKMIAEIASTRKLAANSVRSALRVARRLKNA